jgi:hypothetical protein
MDAGKDREKTGMACTGRLLRQSRYNMPMNGCKEGMKNMKFLRLSLILFIIMLWTVESRAEGLPVKDLPASGKSLNAFLSRGWTVEDQASGDLNGDGVSDISAILVQGKAGVSFRETDDDHRALIVLLGHDKGEFTLAGTNDRLLQCRGCGGVRESVGVSIRKEVIIVQQMTGSRDFSDETWRFRYHPQKQRFVIIGRDMESGDGMLGTGTIVSFNHLTGRKITKNYRYDKKADNKIVTSTKKENGSWKTPFMEDVKASY